MVHDYCLYQRFSSTLVSSTLVSSTLISSTLVALSLVKCGNTFNPARQQNFLRCSWYLENMFRFSPPLQRRWCQNSGRSAAATRLSRMLLGTLTNCVGGRLTKSSSHCSPTLPELCLPYLLPAASQNVCFRLLATW